MVYLLVSLTDSGSMIAKSPEILEKLEVVRRIAKTDSSVLILGEVGVGKGLFAELIHSLSLRSTAPLVKINCSALPGDFLEGELFGYVKGAFAAAFESHTGSIERADKGTVFFEEIGNIPLSVQAKLLRVIQEKAFEKLGTDTLQFVDVRILAASSQDIEAMVEKGEFIKDLYYRINVLPLYIPPLRQRTEDVHELAEYFLKKYQAEQKKQFNGFSMETKEFMLSYSWPGNIQELENRIERACITGKEIFIQKEDMFMQTFSESSETNKKGYYNLKNAVNNFKVHFIQKVLEENNWNQTEAAKALDIQRTYLSRLIKELSIKEH